MYKGQYLVGVMCYMMVSRLVQSSYDFVGRCTFSCGGNFL
jgi:hypothetical protein